MQNSSYLIDHLRDVGLSWPLPRSTRLLRSTFGPPGTVHQRPGSSGYLVPPNVSVQNQVNQFGPFPSLYGQYRYFPPYAGVPYQEYEGRDIYTRALYVVGYGPVEYVEFWIGNRILNLVWDGNIGYDAKEDVYVEALTGLPSDGPMTTYPGVVIPDANQIKLTDGWQYKETTAAADEVVLLFQWPSGLCAKDSDGNLQGYNVTLNIEYGLTDAEGTTPSSYTEVPNLVTSAVTQVTFERSARITFPSRGLYIVRVKRAVAQSDNGDVSDECDWQEMDTMVNTDPIPPLYHTDGTIKGIAKFALRAKVTDQKQQTLDNVSAVIKRLLPVYDGTSWNTVFTASCAWAMIDQVCGKQNLRAVNLSRSNSATLKAWADAADAIGLQFNNVYDQGQQGSQSMQDIATAGRATFRQQDGLYSVNFDTIEDQIVQIFTPRNSANCKFQKNYLVLPHGLRVQWTNPAILYQQDEIYVYADGYSQDGEVPGTVKATQFETFPLVGVTSAAQAHKLGRYYLAVGVLRPRIITLDVDFEHLRCYSGDRVGVNHDILLIGSGCGYISALQTDGSGNITGVTLDDSLGMDSDKVYNAIIRLSDGTTLSEQVVTTEGLNTNLVFSTPITYTLPTLPKVGDLLVFGTYPITDFIITKIEPSTDQHMGATLTLVDYSPNIFNSDTDDIGEFVSQITLPFAEQNRTVTQPKVVSIQSDESVMVIGSDGTPQPRIVVNLSCKDATVTAFESRYMVTGSNGNWTTVAPVSASAGQVPLSLQPVQSGLNYDIQVRAVTTLGLASDWVEIDDYLCIGNTSPPPDVTSANVIDGILSWTSGTLPLDFAGYYVKQITGSSVNWDGGVFVVQGLVTVNQLDVSKLPGGTRTLMIKMVDTSGNLSNSTASVTIDIGDPIVSNLILSTDFKAGGFPGTISGGSVSGGNLLATSLGNFWSSNDSQNQWSGTDTDLEWNGQYSDLTYICSFTVTSSEIPGTLVVTASLSDGGTIQYRVQGSNPLMWNVTSTTLMWSGTDTDDEWVEDFGPWMPWNGSLTADDVTYEFEFDMPGGLTRGEISALSIGVDVPDVIEILNNITIASSGGTRLPIASTFKVVKNVMLTQQYTGGTGVSPVCIDKVATVGAGPLVKIFDASNNSVGGEVDATIQGY